MPALVNELQASVAEVLEEAGETAPHFVGRRSLYKSGAPHYVWVPTRDAPKGDISKMGTNPRAFESQKVGFEVHCWGFAGDRAEPTGDYDVAWQMSRNIFAALQEALGANWNLETSGFLQERDDWKYRGQVYVAAFSVNVPLVDQIVPTIEVQGTEHSMVIQLSSDETVC